MPVLTSPSAPTHALGDVAHFTSLATPSRGSADTSVWRVSLAPGHPATPHELTREEVFVVLAGRARVQLGGQAFDVVAGDTIVVPRNTPFALAAVGTEPFDAICCLPVGGEARMPDGSCFVPPWAL
jgi:quercetin dioxygenase-like cupin family protein